MRHARRQKEHVAGFYFDVHGPAILDNLDSHRALDLQKQLLALVHVVVFAGVGAAHYHHDKILVVLEDLLVAYRRLQQMAVLVDPGLQVEGAGHFELRIRNDE